ncbi:hypothetical protein DL96DRAFT_1691738 [Flagelloscypha sp. PMI_526]|nr:hypothetical protein DL96DRAFT_1691738 [Flagelloscypha sp. PMI_526]
MPILFFVSFSFVLVFANTETLSSLPSLPVVVVEDRYPFDERGLLAASCRARTKGGEWKMNSNEKIEVEECEKEYLMMVSGSVSERICEELVERRSRNMGLNGEAHLGTCEGETRLVDLDLSGQFGSGTDENGTGDGGWALRWPGGRDSCGEECRLKCKKVGIPGGKKGIFEGNGDNGMSILEPGNDFLQWC